MESSHKADHKRPTKHGDFFQPKRGVRFGMVTADTFDEAAYSFHGGDGVTRGSRFGDLIQVHSGKFHTSALWQHAMTGAQVQPKSAS